MDFKLLKRSHLKRNIIIGVVVVAIISAIILNFTRAKYRTTQSIPLVNGTINYELSDLNLVGVYIQGDDGYTKTDTIPESGYVLNEEESYCTVNGEEDASITINYNAETKSLSVSPMATKGTKCYLYFDENKTPKNVQELIASKNLATRTNFRTTVTEDTTGTIYYADTSKGRTYYFAGNPTDNWVRWAGFYWRIIRINGDGTIRLIYNGTSNSQTGSGTQIIVNSSNTSAFNSTCTDNMYVGYMYQSNQVHGLTRSSNIKGVLDEWYQNNLASYADDIDGNAGFCGDRTPSTSSSSINNSGGTGTTTTYYGYVRLYGQSNGVPTFECASDSDLYTTSGSSDGNRALQYPIGLISMDEAWYAGGYSANNSSYYLYTGQNYWTMSPTRFNGGYAYVFRVNSSGHLGSDRVYYKYGVRPVINLKANIQFSEGNGTSDKPLVVS